MRVMMLLEADETAMADAPPPAEILEAMGRYNEELVKAGVLLAGEGLRPTSQGVKLTFGEGGTTVTDGPFAEGKEVVCGFWMLQVRSLDEAMEWGKRCPLGGGAVLEIRPVGEIEDFGDVMTPEMREREERLRSQIKGL